MKIYHWIPTCNLGGCEVLLNSFIDNTSKDIKHIILTTKAGDALSLWKQDNVSIRYIPEWEKRNPLIWTKIIRGIIKTDKIEKIIFWSPSRMPFIKLCMKGFEKTQAIVHVGSLVNTKRSRYLIQKAIDSVTGCIVSKNITLVGCSNYVGESLQRDLYFKSINISSVLNCVRSYIIQSPLKRCSCNERLRICTLGRLDPVKGHAQMIKYVVNAYKSGINCIFDIYGSGSEYNLLNNLILQNNASHYISLKGSTQDIISCLDNYNVFLFNSAPLEGMGISLAEAMCRGLICVVNDTKLMHEMLGDKGYYFSSGNEFCKQMSNIYSMKKEQLKQISEEIRNLSIEKFSPEIWANKYIKLLEQNE